ncbi:hypothetical protein RB195_006091 [Necator americanus]|uniref:Uncharacterized protein n=1 Tax=Necator americanus TaxID=51031 RepID=A0ABR1BQX7_NECAM
MTFVALKRAVGGLLGQEDSLDVGQNSSLSNGHTGKQLVELLVVANGELEMARVDSALLVVTGSGGTVKRYPYDVPPRIKEANERR